MSFYPRFCNPFCFHPLHVFVRVRGTYPRRHGENMQTPHRKTPWSTPPFWVWAPMTQSVGHAAIAHSFPKRESNPGPSSCEAERYPTAPPCLPIFSRSICRSAISTINALLHNVVKYVSHVFVDLGYVSYLPCTTSKLDRNVIVSNKHKLFIAII